MKTTAFALILALNAGAALCAQPAAHTGKPAGGTMECCAKCAMCKAKMAGGKGHAGHNGGDTKPGMAGKPGMGMMAGKSGMGMMGGKSGMGMMGGKPGMGGMMGGMAGPAPSSGSVAISVTPDGFTYVVRGDVVYKFDADLKPIAQAKLSGPAPRPSAESDEHGSHHKP